MARRFPIAPCLFVLLVSGSARATELLRAPSDATMTFDLPLVDLPYQLDAAQAAANRRPGAGSDAEASVSGGDIVRSYANPSMVQSVHWSASWLTLWGHGVNTVVGWTPRTSVGKVIERGARELTFTAVNIPLMYFPLADGWVHEEFHRAMLATTHVKSFDDIDTFTQFGSDHISVTRIRDEDLSAFKRDDPVGFNRMLVAGGEGELLLSRRLELNNFFLDSGIPITLYNAFIRVLVYTYPASDTSASNDADLARRELDETDVADRDITGPDYAGWAWHIFKPDVPYEALGVHPTGVGIDRYKTVSDLTVAEKDYLELASKVLLLNFVSPMTTGINRIRLGDGYYGNFAFRSMLNGYGFDINPEAYLKTPRHSLILGVHNYRNYENSFWGVEAALLRERLFDAFDRQFTVDARAMAWAQPKNQEFMTSKAEAGGLLEAKLYAPVAQHLEIYLDGEGKSAGWVAGNPFLNANLSARTGVAMSF